MWGSISQGTGKKTITFTAMNTPTNLILTAGDYVQANIWYDVKIVRTLAGAFTVLIKGGSLVATAGYGTWTLVGLVTENTHTSSSYFVSYRSVGDRITNIKLTDSIKAI